MRGAAAGRRRLRSPTAGLRRFWIALLVLLVIAALGGYYGSSWKDFNPRSVRVSGNSVVPSAAILQAAAIARNRNLWLQNMGAAERRVEAIPYIAHAWIHRRLPADAAIVVQERTPFATLGADGEEALVDRSLRVLSDAPDSTGTVPLLAVAPGHALRLAPGKFVIDEQTVALRNDCEALAAANVPMRRLSFDRYEQLTGVLRNGVLLLLGSDADIARKIPLIEPILSQLAHARPVRAIDLRAVNTPVVVYK